MFIMRTGKVLPFVCILIKYKPNIFFCVCYGFSRGNVDDVDDGERTVRLPRVGQAFGRFIAVKSKMEDSLVLEQSFIAKLLLLRFVTTLVAYVAKDLKQGGK